MMPLGDASPSAAAAVVLRCCCRKRKGECGPVVLLAAAAAGPDVATFPARSVAGRPAAHALLVEEEEGAACKLTGATVGATGGDRSSAAATPGAAATTAAVTRLFPEAELLLLEALLLPLRFRPDLPAAAPELVSFAACCSVLIAVGITAAAAAIVA